MKTTKHTYIKLITIACILITCFTTCKKYPEDKFAFRTVKARLDAEWQIQNIEIDGTDAIGLYNDSLAPLKITDLYFWFVFDNLIQNQNKEQTKNLLLVNTSSKSYKNAYNNNDFGITHFAVENTPHGKKSALNLGGIREFTYDEKKFQVLLHLLNAFSYEETFFIKSLYHKTLIIQKEKNNHIYRIYFKRTQR